MHPYSQIIALREAGAVQRTHTRTIFGEYTIAGHSWNALNLLFLLWPEEDDPPSLQLIIAIAWHDIAERWTGDVPAPTKWISPTLKNTLDILEQKVLRALELHHPFVCLSSKEKSWLKGVDTLELYLWSKEQAQVGNNTVLDMQQRILSYVKEHQELYPKEILDCFQNLFWERVPEIDDLLPKENI